MMWSTTFSFSSKISNSTPESLFPLSSNLVISKEPLAKWLTTLTATSLPSFSILNSYF